MSDLNYEDKITLRDLTKKRKAAENRQRLAEMLVGLTAFACMIAATVSLIFIAVELW
jgi:hypothetical protein